MTIASLQFPFDCNISLGGFRKLWRSLLKTQRTQFCALECPRTVDNVSSFLEELNDFDLLRQAEDIDGVVWQGLHPNTAFRDEATLAEKAFTAFDAEVVASSAIAKNVALYEASISLTEDESRRMLQQWKRTLKQGGAYLEPEKKSKVQKLMTDIQDAMNEFKDNVRSDDRHVELTVEELKGVPDDYLLTHPVDGVTGKIHVHGKYVYVGPILEYCQVRDTREKCVRLLDNMASPVNEAVLKRLLGLRKERANLLGYTHWADYQLEGTMAKTTEKVLAFLDEVVDAVQVRSKKETSLVAKLLEESDGIIDMKSWDVMYGITLLKSHLLPGFNMKDTRQYFPIERAFPAIQKIAQDLFRIRFDPIENVQAWHSSVSACLVYDTSAGQDELLGRLFFDVYARDGKSDGASAWFVRPSVSDRQLAEVILVANLEIEQGTCMSYKELRDILHELGHCVHALLGKSRYARLSGPLATQMDFMEMPSQMLELWLTEKSLFDFAVNNKGQRIPDEVLDKILAAEAIGRGILQNGQLVFAKLALDLHTAVLTAGETTRQITESAFRKYCSPFMTPGASRQHNFKHLANPIYASRYYAYLFSQVICHDLFTEFSKSGDLMGKSVVMRYRKDILEKGGSSDGEDMVEAFLGRKYNATAFKLWMNEDIDMYE